VSGIDLNSVMLTSPEMTRQWSEYEKTRSKDKTKENRNYQTDHWKYTSYYILK